MARPHLRRSSLLLGGAGLAIAAALALPSQARAQAFNAGFEFVRGDGTVNRQVANTDTITITTSTAVLDWTPFEDESGNALTFLPNGRTAFFQDGPGQGGFAVLNRILPSTNGDVAVFNGTVISRLQAADGTLSNGGTVAFYSPTGILVGNSAVFDVGQLLLTTLDPDLDSFESFAAGGVLQLAGPAGTTSAVDIRSGAQITATGENSFFSVVAPQVIMRGDAYINGSTAYVAGEQVSLSYNNGLFDIQVPVGTTVGTAIRHVGSTGGPASTGGADGHAIYAVARGNGNPITMLLSGNLGFDAAVTAGVENGEIVLSAGYDVFGTNGFTHGVDEEALSENIAIVGPTAITSGVNAVATGTFEINSSAGAIDLDGGLSVRAAREAALVARNENSISIAGDVSLASAGTIEADGDVVGGVVRLVARDASTLSIGGELSAEATPSQDQGTATGGQVDLMADGGTIEIAGDVRLSAQANRHFPTGTLGDGFGGVARVFALNEGAVDLGGFLIMDTNAFGNGVAGYEATGGISEIVAQSGGTVDVAGFANILASGFGGDADGSLGIIDGGDGFGGSAQVIANGGTINFADSLLLNSEGNGGSGASFFGSSFGDSGGDGFGGQSLLNATDGSISVAGTTTLYSFGSGGQGAAGGSGTGGLAQVFANGTGTIRLGDAVVQSMGFGANGLGDDGRGGDGLGGEAIILTQDSGDVRLTGSADVQANGWGEGGNSGGNGTGGNAGIYAMFGNIAVDGSAYVSAQGFGGGAVFGFGGSGGNGQGGTAYIQADGSQAASASVTIGGRADILASGFGGIGGAGDGVEIEAGDGGIGVGGIYQGEPGTGGAFAIAGRDNGTLVIGGITYLQSWGYGGDGGMGGAGQAGGSGGAGFGGTIQAGTFSGGGNGSVGAGRAQFDRLLLDASGYGGSGGDGGTDAGDGGSGTGGFAGVFALGSRVEAGAITTNANGYGGFGANGGGGYGGSAGIGIVDGTLTAFSVGGDTGGIGGDGIDGDGGEGIGGEISIDADSGLTIASDLFYNSQGIGGTSETGTGGRGVGGIARISGTGSAILDIGGTVNFDAVGIGGSGATGGDGTGGTAGIDLTGSSTFNAGQFNALANGFGGDGGTSGTASGGLARMFAGAGTRLSVLGTGLLSANATGGAGFASDGGNANAGIGEVIADGGEITFGNLLRISANGLGGGVLSGFGTGGDGAGGTIEISAVEGGTISLWSVQATAGGQGGSGANAVGGMGTGGDIVVTASAIESVIEILNERSVMSFDSFAGTGMFAANGFGGSTTGGNGIGGVGVGGEVSISALDGGLVALPVDPAEGGTGSVGYNGILARGYGGGSSVDGGRGGDAFSGLIAVLADGGTFRSGDMLASVFAQGGNSLDSELDIKGGNAFGGVRTFSAENGGSMRVSMIGGGAGAVGGNASGTGIGGDATGGTALLFVDNADVTFVGRGLFFAGATGGAGRIGGNATGGNVFIFLSNGARVEVVPDAQGRATLGLANPVFGGAGTERGGNAIGDSVTIQISNSTFDGQLVANALAYGGLSEAGSGGDATGGTFNMIADGSTLSLLSGSRIDTSAFGGNGIVGGSATGGQSSMIASNGTLVDVYGSPDGFSTLALESSATGGSGEEVDGNAAGGDVSLRLFASTLTAPSVSLAANALTDTGDAVAGTVFFGAADESIARIASLVLDASADGTGSGTWTGGFAGLVSGSGSVVEIGSTEMEASGETIAGAFEIVANNGSMALDTVYATAVGAAAGDASRIVANGGSIPISSYASFETTGDFGVTTASGGLIGGPTVFDPTASISVLSGGTVTIAGDNDAQIGFGGRDLFISSRDLQILPGARIGAQFLALNVIGNDAATVIGGTGETAGYTLTQAEVARIEAGSVYFSSSFDGLASDDILVRDTTIAGSLDDGPSSVFLQAGGIVRVEGILAYVDAAQTDEMAISAQRLEIVTPGGIGIVDPQGRPTGTFSFYGNDFWMADADTIARLREEVSFEGRNELLATAAEGSADPLGYLRAGNVFLGVGDSLLVRNTGTAEAPGGITVTGNLSISGVEFGSTEGGFGDTGSSIVDLFAYGRRVEEDGSSVTGQAFFETVNFNTADSEEGIATQYAEGSQFNNCEIATGECATVEPPAPPEPPSPPEVPDEREEIFDEIDEEAPATSTITTDPVAPAPIAQSEQDADVEFGADFPGLLNASLIAEEGAVDDPVASGGDIAFYGTEPDEEDGDREGENGDDD